MLLVQLDDQISFVKFFWKKGDFLQDSGCLDVTQFNKHFCEVEAWVLAYLVNVCEKAEREETVPNCNNVTTIILRQS
jgi:hypothetical protein